MIGRKRSKRKVSGGLYHDFRKKRKSEQASFPTLTRMGTLKRKVVRVLGGNEKQRVLLTDTVMVTDGKKQVQAKLKSVVENKANRNFIRRNIITKGAIVETDKGKVKITSRPGQTGTLQGTLVKEEK